MENISLLIKSHSHYKKIQTIEEIIGMSFDYDNSPWLAGGYCRKKFFKIGLGKSDIDIFVKNEETYNKINRNLIQNFDFVIGKESRFAMTYNSRLNNINNIQLIKKPFPTLEELLNAFDFTMCSCSMDKTNYYFVKNFIKDNKNKMLISKNILTNYNLSRMAKFIEEGFMVSDEYARRLNDFYQSGEKTVYFYDQ